MFRTKILALVTLVLIATALRALPAQATSAPAPSSPCCAVHHAHAEAHQTLAAAHPEFEGSHEGHQLAGGECTRCNGSRECSVCDGSGKNNSGNPCSICNGSGKCYFCGGSGKGS